MLRQHFGARWRRTAPAEITIRLRKGHQLGEALADARKLVERIAKDQGTAPETDLEVFTNAVLYYRDRMGTGMAPSERALCERFGLPPTKRRWARKVIAHAHRIHSSGEVTAGASELEQHPMEANNA
ncbi:hypothetical protein MRI28_31630 [Nocardiopsis dassonvillei]|uniref:hypothetical protein n=1 Tax=Nocardiopsis dassonvillei TaxID=2014 RepID=UPI002010753C|nr:hypothetical protein [Nocardiopsis dassonvillei]MCK9874120.1 hypothetical protein [Nocardiopsis dassonvillei]